MNRTLTQPPSTTDHHHNLSRHPQVPESISPTPTSVTNGSTSINTLSAAQCPALRGVPSTSEEKALDENVCPVVGPVTTVLPPNHPSVEESGEESVCPVTNATLKHHKGKVVVHPPVAASGGVCPVVGAKGAGAGA